MVLFQTVQEVLDAYAADLIDRDEARDALGYVDDDDR